MKGGWRLPAQIDLDDVAEEYGAVLAEVSEGALAAVVNKLRAGEYEFCTREILPIPSHFARLCAEARKEITDRIAEIRRTDRRRVTYWNSMPDHLNLRQKEEAIDLKIAELDAFDAASADYRKYQTRS